MALIRRLPSPSPSLGACDRQATPPDEDCDQLADKEAPPASKKRRERAPITLATSVVSTINDIGIVAHNMLINNRNFASGYYAREAPRTADFIRRTLPPLHDAISDRVEYAAGVVEQNMQAFEASLDAMCLVEERLAAISPELRNTLNLAEALSAVRKSLNMEEAQPPLPPSKPAGPSI